MRGAPFVRPIKTGTYNTSSRTFMRLIIGLLLALMVLILSCNGDAGKSSSDPVSLARIRIGEKANGECRFDDDLSKYPVTYSGVWADCLQAVTIGPISTTELEQMKRDEPSFWEKSSPYKQSLLGVRIDGECNFDTPFVRAFLAFSETESTDRTNCIMIVNVGPVTEKQIEEVQRLGGTTESETAVPASSEPVPGQ